MTFPLVKRESRQKGNISQSSKSRVYRLDGNMHVIDINMHVIDIDGSTRGCPSSSSVLIPSLEV